MSGKVEGIDWCDSPVSGFRGWVPCRKCATCKKLKSWRWLQRCLDETAASERTWFTTLTFRKVPDDGGYSGVQRWLKRVRKDLHGEAIRYFCAPEIGSRGGRLHFHLLVHGSGGLKGRVLRSQWREGITHARLVYDARFPHTDTRASARYVAKYTGKDAGRPRASVQYGTRSLLRVAQNEVVRAVLSAFPQARIYRIDLGGDIGAFSPARPSPSLRRKIAATITADRGPSAP